MWAGKSAENWDLTGRQALHCGDGILQLSKSFVVSQLPREGKRALVAAERISIPPCPRLDCPEPCEDRGRLLQVTKFLPNLEGGLIPRPRSRIVA